MIKERTYKLEMRCYDEIDRSILVNVIAGSAGPILRFLGNKCFTVLN